MAVAYVNKQESTRDPPSSPAFAPTLPTGWTVGNLLILSCICYGSGAPTIATPTGWTKIIDGDDNAKKIFSDSNARLYVWVKKAAASEPSPSLTPSGSVDFHCLIVEYSGQDPTTPLDGVASVGTRDTDSTINTPAITTTVANTLVIYVYGGDGTGTSSTPAGTTSRHSAVFALLSSRMMFSEIAAVTAGTVAATSHSAGGNTGGLAATFAVQGPSGSGGAAGSILERKAGAASVDTDDWNALVDAVVALGGSVATRKAGSSAVNTVDYNAVVTAVVALGGNVATRKAGSGQVDPASYNALVDAVKLLGAP